MNKLAKDMSKVYRNASTADLIKNKHRKQAELYRLKNNYGYWVDKERKRLLHMIGQIDAELACRAAQKPLF